MSLAIRTERGDTATGWWEMSRAASGPALQTVTAGYTGYREHSTAPVRRREVPTGRVVLIVSFGDPIDIVEMSNARTGPGRFRSFVAGFHEGHAVTEYLGGQAGVELDLSPLAAHRLLGIPMHELADSVIELSDLGLADLTELPERLADAPGWPERFAVLDDVLGARIADAAPVDRAVQWAWDQLDRSDGAVRIGDLAHEIGWSRRHLSSRFRTQVGLTPKAAAGILRFRRAAEQLRAGEGRAGDVAARCGYADQSHLNREFRRLAGCTPTAYAAGASPETLGVAC